MDAQSDGAGYFGCESLSSEIFANDIGVCASAVGNPPGRNKVRRSNSTSSCPDQCIPRFTPPGDGKNSFSKTLGRIGKSLKSMMSNQKSSIPKRATSLKENRRKGKFPPVDGFNSLRRENVSKVGCNPDNPVDQSLIVEREGKEKGIQVSFNGCDAAKLGSHVNECKVNSDEPPDLKQHSAKPEAIPEATQEQRGETNEDSFEILKERTRCEKLEHLLQMRRIQQNVLDRCINVEKEKIDTLKKNFDEEKAWRLEMEKKLQVSRSGSGEGKKVEVEAGNGSLKRKAWSNNRSISSSSPSSCHRTEIDLRSYIMALGHTPNYCPELKLNRYSCSGYLQKLGNSKLKVSWKKRWFEFDRKMRAFCYYPDERKTKLNGILYFQCIEEVYVDNTMTQNSHLKMKFCIQTPQRLYALAAPSPVALGIWIDVLCTGIEGTFAPKRQ